MKASGRFFGEIQRARGRGAGAAVLLLALCAGPALATRQQPPSPAGKTDDTANQPAAGAKAADAAPYNPLPAEKDVEVAVFYMRKGDPDAAIPRLEEAIRLKPNYAKPREMLGEIYEKKDDSENALKYYREYLQVYPHAPDAKKIQGKIDKLSKQ